MQLTRARRLFERRSAGYVTAEALTKDMNRDARPEEQGRVRVPEIIGPKPRQPGRVEQCHQWRRFRFRSASGSPRSPAKTKP